MFPDCFDFRHTRSTATYFAGPLDLGPKTPRPNGSLKVLNLIQPNIEEEGHPNDE